MITTQSIKILDDDRLTRQELDLDFLRTGYRRRVYVAAAPDLGCRLPAQRCRTSLLVVPIPVGNGPFGRLTYLEGGQVRTIELEQGAYYYVPPEAPFEIAIEGVGVLELYTPVTGGLLWFDEEPLGEGYFEARIAAHGCDGTSDPH